MRAIRGCKVCIENILGRARRARLQYVSVCKKVGACKSVANVAERATVQACNDHPMHGPIRTCPGSRHTDQSRDCGVDFPQSIHLSFEMSQQAEIDHTWAGQTRPL